MSGAYACARGGFRLETFPAGMKKGDQLAAHLSIKLPLFHRRRYLRPYKQLSQGQRFYIAQVLMQPSGYEGTGGQDPGAFFSSASGLINSEAMASAAR